MVIDQGTILDRIDFNMESAVVNATVAVTNLKKAGLHQKEAGKCIIA
jgi:syntaxin 16